MWGADNGLQTVATGMEVVGDWVLFARAVCFEAGLLLANFALHSSKYTFILICYSPTAGETRQVSKREAGFPDAPSLQP